MGRVCGFNHRYRDEAGAKGPRRRREVRRAEKRAWLDEAEAELYDRAPSGAVVDYSEGA